MLVRIYRFGGDISCVTSFTWRVRLLNGFHHDGFCIRVHHILYRVNIVRHSGRAGQLQRNGFILDHQLGDLPETGNFIQLQLS